MKIPRIMRGIFIVVFVFFSGSTIVRFLIYVSARTSTYAGQGVVQLFVSRLHRFLLCHIINTFSVCIYLQKKVFYGELRVRARANSHNIYSCTHRASDGVHDTIVLSPIGFVTLTDLLFTCSTDQPAGTNVFGVTG